ncbi:hypothetical protein P3T73_09755 [Kiritimatiellota bacterium B12222]|nr:hypothetical protein P3T73_09755 [Kiritimatiellota bacterium B12222]
MTDPYIELAKHRDIPSCPKNLEAQVLRRIRLHQQDLTPSRLPFNLSTAMAFTMIAILFTATATLSLSSAQNRKATQRQYAIQALDFDVFHNLTLQPAARSVR